MSNLLPNKLRELRKLHNYTQDDVACALGVIRQTYSHYETGKRTPDSETLLKLSYLYKIDINDFMQLLFAPKTEGVDYYEAPAKSENAKYLEEFIDFASQPFNSKKLASLTGEEKEILFYFQKFSPEDKRELIEFSKLKIQFHGKRD